MLRQSTTDAAMDPFLSGINKHARQESADSGLGLGSAYSLPHTPEDFLANIDDNMDGTSGKSSLGKNVSECETFPATYPAIIVPITAFAKDCAKKNVVRFVLLPKSFQFSIYE